MSEETTTPEVELCPCGSGHAYDECCKKVHDGESWPETAEDLVRARYCAYAERRFQFLLDSALPELNKDLTVKELEESTKNVTWVRLEILGTDHTTNEEDGQDYDVVDFLAYYRIGEGTYQIGERSYFRRVDGKLLYAAAEKLRTQPLKRGTPKVGRNDPCPCGSGKKYKKCCGRNA